MSAGDGGSSHLCFNTTESFPANKLAGSIGYAICQEEFADCITLAVPQ
jgi:hypothetical protein